MNIVTCSTDNIPHEILTASRNCLGNKWIGARDDQIKVKKILGGLTNTIYLLELLNSEVQTEMCDKNSVNRCLLRIFNKMWSSEDIERGNCIFEYIANSGIGPALLGNLPNHVGRLEEFYDARPLLTKELSVYFIDIARSLSVFHKLSPSLDTGPAGSFIFNCMRAWLENINQALLEHSSEFASKCKQICGLANLTEEIVWLEKYTRESNFSTAFCHSDINENNILLMNNNDSDGRKQIKLIDFEFSCKNYRGFEFANTFYEFTFDYSATEYPYFIYTPENYPTLEQRREFFFAYLSSYEDDVSQIDIQSSIDKLITETDRLQMMVDMAWTLWSLSMLINAKKFGYSEYASLRLKFYLFSKQMYKV